MKKILIAAGALLLLAGPAHAADVASTDQESQQNADIAAQTTKNEQAPGTVRAQADPNSIRVYATTPFKYNNPTALLIKRDFTDVARSYEIEDDFDSFAVTFSRVLTKSQLCASATGSTTAAKLRDCANKYPDEFAAVTNELSRYATWKEGEIRLFVGLYSDKRHSTLFRDRIEARLMNACLQHALNTNVDAGGAVARCRQAKNWDLSDLFAGLNASICTADPTTGTTGTSTKTSFSFAKFVKNCVASPSLAVDSPGVQLAADLTPSFDVTVETRDGGGSVTVQLKPSKVSPADVYSLVYARLVGDSMDKSKAQATDGGILNSSWFRRGATNGRIPSAFSPTLFNPSAAGAQYIIGLPPKLIDTISTGLPSGDRDFFIERLARKIALIETAEIIHGAQLLTIEAQRALAATDTELGNVAKVTTQYFAILSDGYRDAIRQSSVSTVADILTEAAEQRQRIANAEAEYESNASALRAEIAKKHRRLSGAE